MAFHGNDGEEKSGTLSSTIMMAFTLSGRQKDGDDIRSSGIIELYQLVIYEILDMVPQMLTFFHSMPLSPIMVFTLLRRIKTK